MREKLFKFMSGRYGQDQFSRFLFGAAVVFMLITMLTRTQELYWLALAALVFGYWRMLSRNHSARYRENQRYLKYHNRFIGFFKGKINIQKQRKTHHIYSCPSCKQKIRIPRGKGKIAIICPKCRTEFVKKS